MNVSSSVGSELKRLFRQSSHYLTAMVLNLGLGFVSFPIFTRVFTVADYGVIDLVQRVLLLLTAASKLGQQNSALRFYDKNAFATDPGKERQYYSTLYLGVAGLSGGVVLLFLAILPLIPVSVLPRLLGPLLVFTCVLTLLRAIQSLIWSFLRIEERTEFYNVMSVLIRAGTILAVVVLLPVMGPSVRTYYAGTTAVEVLVVLALTVPLIWKGLLRLKSFDRTLFWSMLGFGSPLVVQELAGIVLDSGDRFLVQIYLGADSLGFFSVASGLAGYVNTLMIAPLGLAILPIYMRLWNTEGREKTIQFLSIGLEVFLIAAALVFAVVAATSHDAVLLMASAKYRGADALIPTMVAGLLLYSTHAFTAAGLVIQKKTGTLAMGLIYSAALKMVLNVVLLPRLGLQGGAIATLIGYSFCCIYLAWVSGRILPLEIHYASVARYLMAASASWFAGASIDFGWPVLNVFGKAAIVCGVYAALLWSIDARARDLSRVALKYLKSQGTEVEPVVLV